MTHKPHKATGGSHEKAQATGKCMGAAIGQCCDTKCTHAPIAAADAISNQLQNSDTMDIDQGGRCSLLNAIAVES